MGRIGLPKFKSVAELEAKIDGYFEQCRGEVLRNDKTDEPVLDKQGRVVMIGEKPPTLSGLALALGFTSRAAMLGFDEKPGLREAILRGKLRVEQYAEERLYDKECCTGAKYMLENSLGEAAEDGGGGSAPSGAAAEGVMDEVRRRLAMEAFGGDG